MKVQSPLRPHYLNVVGVCGAGEVGVDILHSLTLVEVFELHLNVGGCLFVTVGAWTGREGGQFRRINTKKLT